MSFSPNDNTPDVQAVPPSPSAGNLPMSARPDQAPSLQDATAGTPAGQPNLPANAAMPTAPAAPATPAEKHASIFHNVMGMLAGGMNRPVRGPNGQPVTDESGNVVMKPAGAKQLGAGILAGAIASMVAGMSTPTQMDPQGRRPDYSNAVAAGAKAAEPYTQKGSQEAAQKQADDTKMRQYTTTDHNLKLHAALMNNLKMQGDILQEGVDTDAPIIEGLATAGTVKDPTDPTGVKTIPAVQAQKVGEDKLMAMMNDGSLHVTRDSILRDGVADVYDEKGKQRMNPDGTPMQQYTYTVYNHNAQVVLSEQMKGLSPNLKDVSVGTVVPVSVLGKYAREQADLAGAGQALKNHMSEYDEVNGTKTNFDLSAATAKYPALKRIYPYIAKYGTDPVDLMFKDLRAEKSVDSAALGQLQQALGVTPEGLQKMAQDRAAKMNAEKKGNDALPAPIEQVKSFRSDIGTAYPNLSEGQKDLLTKSLGKTPTNGDYQKIQDKAEKYSDSNTRLEAQKAKDAPADPALVKSIGTGHMAPDRVAYLLAKNPALLVAVTDAYPDFDSSKAASYAKTYVDFTSGKTSRALNAGATALRHLNELQTLNTKASMIPGTPDHTAYQNKVDTLASELSSFYKGGGAPTNEDIQGIKDTLLSKTTWNRNAAIKTQAHSMGDKLDAYEQQWQNAAPSSSYEAEMPFISDDAKAARHELDPDYTYTPGKKSTSNITSQPTVKAPSGAFDKVKASDGNYYWRDKDKNVLGKVGQ